MADRTPDNQKPTQLSWCSSSSSGAEEPENIIKDFVKEKYAQVAEGTSCCAPLTGTSRSRDLAQHMGYEEKDLANIPDAVLNSFAGCGNPLAIEELKKGDVVLDLGSGAGLDCFLAATKVGPQGKVIGLDMTREMMKKAEANREKLGLGNVEFRLAEMEKMPVDDASVDAIISNCVINLSPEKEKVFREAYRVLKPGGRFLISDIVLEKDLSPETKRDLKAWASCVAGAVLEKQYIQMLAEAGFAEVKVLSKVPYKSSYGQVVSAKIRAVKKKRKKAS